MLRLAARTCCCRGSRFPSAPVRLARTRRTFLTDILAPESTIKHTKSVVVPLSRDDLFAVVSDVARYDEFLPYCVSSEVVERMSETEMHADLEIGFQVFTERYRSRVTLSKPHFVEARSIDSHLFARLCSVWRFEVAANHSASQPQTQLSFDIDFEVRSPVHAHAVQLFFGRVAELQMHAFVDRCHELAASRPAQPVAADADPVAEPQRAPAVAVAAPPSLIASTPLSIRSFFSDKQVQLLSALFAEHCDPRTHALDVDGFRRVCGALSRRRGAVFSRYRHRSVLKACHEDEQLCESVFSFLPGRGERNQLSLPSLLTSLHVLTRTNPDEQFALAFAADGVLSVDEAALRSEHLLKTQISIIRQIMPGMVHKHTQSTIDNQHVVDSGLRTLGMIGVMEETLEKKETEVEDLIEAARRSVAARDGQVSTAEWVDKCLHLAGSPFWDSLSVLGFASLIDWACLIKAD